MEYAICIFCGKKGKIEEMAKSKTGNAYAHKMCLSVSVINVVKYTLIKSTEEMGKLLNLFQT